MKRIVCVCLLLMSLMLFAAAEESMVGVWGFSDGVQAHGDGFFLYADGNGEWLEAIHYSYFPLSEFVRMGEKFTWKTAREGEKQYLIENYPDGSERKWEIRRIDDSLQIYTPNEESNGFYWPIETNKLTLGNKPLDVIWDLQAKKGKFTKNKTYNVWQGPGEEYGRSGGGKGKVSTNGYINCYGTWNDYLLIEYEISKNKHRFGWIALDSLPSSQADDYAALDFSKDNMGCYRCGILTADAVLTDDPFYSGNAVKQLLAGTSVFVLMQDKDFLLVEGFLGKERFMGFVPADAVDMRYGYAENAKITIDKAVTFTEDEIYAAAEAVKDIVYERFSGTSIVEIKYIEAESADADDWWQPEVENREGMQLFVDLNGMSFYDYEIAAYGVAKDYGFILYRDKNGGEWEVGNWGYE